MSESGARPPLHAALVQFRPRKARVEENLARVRACVGTQAGEVDLVVFPETCLTGYFLEGGVVERSLEASSLAGRLGRPPDGAPDVVLGFYERWRRRLYNSVAWLTPAGQAWRVVHVHRKMFLPTYGIFDEARFVETGQELTAFDTRFGRVGMLVCEEMWHSLPSAVLALGGAELVVVASASPARGFHPGRGRPGNVARWEGLVPATAIEHGIFVLVSQLVGTEGGKIFPGGALAAAPDGEVLGRGPLMDEAVVRVVLDGGRIERARFDAPLLADLEHNLPHLTRALERARELSARTEARGNGGADPGRLGGDGGRSWRGDGRVGRDADVLDLDLELVRQTLVRFVREEVERRGFQKVVLGVSGGVDSALSLYLAAEALGPENVYGFRLPHRESSPESLEHAGRVLDATGVQVRTVDITDTVEALIRATGETTDRRKGNLMARARAVILFDRSAALEALPLGTGNKSERLLGYYTWHADDSPPINPLGDLFKTQVWALARHVGVPDSIVEKPATADLVRGVTDEDEIGIAYREADPILHFFLKGYHPDDLVREGFEREPVELVWSRLNATHWKRELPTVAVLSSSAIGEFYLRPVDY